MLKGKTMPGHHRQDLIIEDTTKAWSTIKEFYETFNREEAAAALWFLVSIVMKADNEEVNARERRDALHFYESSLALFDAASLLNEERKGK